MTTRFEDVASFSEKRAPERERKKKKRRRRNSEDDDDVGVLPRWKIIMVFAAMGICFAMLFPNVFGPIFSLVFGKKDPAQPPPQRQPDHPAMGGGDRARAPRPPMPGGRMAGFENQPQQTSSRGGMFTWLMPFYTVGVMAFLIYSLMKMRSKGKKKRKRKSKYEDTEDSEESDSNDDTGLGHKNLRSIQERLEETEMAMAKILEQLEEIAKIHPDATSTDDLREKYTADQVAEVENNLAELNRLSALCKKQRRQLREHESGSSESEGSEEEGFDDNLEEVEQAIKEVQDAEVSRKGKSTKIEEKSRKSQKLEQKSTAPAQRSQKAAESLRPETARPIKKANRRKRAHEKDNAGPEDDYSQDEVQIPEASQNSESSDEDVEISSTFVEPPSSRSSTSKISSTNVEKEDINEPIDIILGSDLIETKKEGSPKNGPISPRSQRSKGHEFKIDDIHRPAFDDFVEDFRPQTPEEEEAAKIGEELFEPREERESSEIPLEDGLDIEYQQRVSPDQYSGRFEYDPLREDQEVKELLLGENDEDLIDDMEGDQLPCTSLEEEDKKLPEPPKEDDLDMDQLLQDEAKKAEAAPHIRVFESSREICNELLSDDLPITSLKSDTNLTDLAHDEDETGQKSESQSTSTGKKGKNRRNKKKTSESPKNSTDSSGNSSSRAAPELVHTARAQVVPIVTVQPESTRKPSEPSAEASRGISQPSADQNDPNSGIECANPLFNADSGAGVRQRKSGGGKKSNIRRRVPKAE